MASISIQLEQSGEQVKISISKYDEHADQWHEPENIADYSEVSEDGIQRIETIEALDLEANAIYKLEIFKTAYSEHD